MAALPRRAMVNDDSTLTAFLRLDTLAPYVHPTLSQALAGLGLTRGRWIPFHKGGHQMLDAPSSSDADDA
jgi:hypothetical protein